MIERGSAPEAPRRLTFVCQSLVLAASSGISWHLLAGLLWFAEARGGAAAAASLSQAPLASRLVCSDAVKEPEPSWSCPDRHAASLELLRRSPAAART